VSTSPQRKSPRLPTWDYTTEWWYFVTICTKNHVPFFGQMCNGRNILTRLGEVASAHWTQIPLHYPSVELDYFVVMPNHVHGILILTSPPESINKVGVGQLQPPPSGSLGMVVNQYKGGVTRWARQNGVPDFRWQSRYFDHIIRNERGLYQIRKYIEENPLR
jgi:REP element-mobilizing transposase RayT